MERGDACISPPCNGAQIVKEEREEDVLAGPLIVNEDGVPGRPPGAESEFIVDGRAAASN